MAVFFTMVLGICVCILGYFIVEFNQQNFIRETEAAIEADMRGIVEASSESLTQRLERRAGERTEQFYLLMDKDGRRLGGNIEMLPSEISIIQEGLVRFDLPPGRALAAKVHRFDDGTRLVVARDIGQLTATYRKIQILSGVIIALMLVVCGVSFFLSVYVVNRINIIAGTARRIIETGDLSQRIQIPTEWDDLSNLAQILNALLARVEGLMDGIRQVSDNISHDLRTPLTRLRAGLEELGRDARLSQDNDLRQRFEGLILEAENLLTVFQAILRISNIGKGTRHVAFQPVALESLLRDLIELYEPLAEEKNITLIAELTACSCRGDRDLLFQACANLLDNAVKFTPEGGRIVLSCREEGGQSMIEVRDSGPGIPEAERSKVFDRFYRGDASRHAPGSGLGLSLVAAVLERHGAQIALSGNAPGLNVCVTFAKMTKM
ncbi:MAG: HAMP domain-containing histidine kinase [Alphaproteobacteria bacterium]|nr:HAMP domain-containing histidine kinase [Alphaproteobacteria bacterium]